jgi:neuropeptide FF receptor 2
MPRGLSKSQARVMILWIWIAASCIVSPWIIVFRVETSGRDNQHYCVESWPKSMDSLMFFLIGNLVLCYCLPLTLISISNGLIWWHVSQRKVPQDSASPAAIKRFHRKTRHGVLRMLSVVTLTFLISWLPVYLIFLRMKLGGPLTDRTESIISITMPFAQWLGTSNSSCNPILYAFLNKKFRDSFKSLISCPTFMRPGHILTRTQYSTTVSVNRQSTPRGGRRVTFRHPIDHV